MTVLDLSTATHRGNVVRVQQEDGQSHMLGVTEPVSLLFELELAETFAGTDGLTVLHEDPHVAVGLHPDSSFTFEYENAAWRLQGQAAVSLVRAVDEYERTGSIEKFRQVERSQSDEVVRQKVVNAVIPTLDADIEPLSEGWLIDDVLFLAWEGQLTPFSGSRKQPRSWDNLQWSLFGFTNLQTDPPEKTMEVDGEETSLRGQEWNFVQRAVWTSNREEFGSSSGLYEAYWRNLERAVKRGFGIDNTEESPDESRFFEEKSPIIGDSGQLLGSERPAETNSIPTADGAATIRDAAVEAASSFRISSYRSHTSGEPHNHGPREHDAKNVFNLSTEIIEDVLHFSPKDHGVLHELVTRRNELIRKPVTVFTDTDDWDDSRWEAIENQQGHAHIREEARVYLETVFDY